MRHGFTLLACAAKRFHGGGEAYSNSSTMFRFLKQRRRQRLRAQPFPPAWRSIITGNLPIFRRLPPEDQAELLGHVQVFLAEKRFEGCSGLELTDEIRVTIAAQACLLLLHRATDYYPELTSILVYPSGYTSYEARHLDGNIWDEGGEPRLGSNRALAWIAAAGLGRCETRRGASLGWEEPSPARVRASARLRRVSDRRRASSRHASGVPDMGASDEQRVCGVAKRRVNRNVDGAGYLRCDEPGRVLRRSNGGIFRAPARAPRQASGIVRPTRPVLSPGSQSLLGRGYNNSLRRVPPGLPTGGSITIPTVRRAYELVGDL